MDGPRFDAMTRGIARRLDSRRAVVAGLTGVLLGRRLSVPQESAAEHAPVQTSPLSLCRAVGEQCKPAKKLPVLHRRLP